MKFIAAQCFLFFFLNATVQTKAHAAAMGDKINQSNQSSSLMSLTTRANNAADSARKWNLAYMRIGGVAAFLGLVAIGAQFVASKKSEDAIEAKDDVIVEKDRLAAADSKEKDRQIGLANQAAKEADERAGEAHKAASLADEKAANANEAAAKLNVRAAELEREAAQLRLELAKIDPMNLPIKSIRADVTLIIKGSIVDWPLAAKPPAPQESGGCTFSLEGDDGALVVLRCTELETKLIGHGSAAAPGTSSFAPDARTFAMSFSWPNNELVFDGAKVGQLSTFRFWIDRENVSSVRLEKEMRGAAIIIPWIDKGAEITTGSCIVTINGSIQKRFIVPGVVTDNASIFLMEETTPAIKKAE
jgi:hypothetical protein